MCPVGYSQKGNLGAARDGANVGLENLDSIHDCADKCKNNPGQQCNSFTYAPSDAASDPKVCTLYAQTDPTTTHGSDQIFCEACSAIDFSGEVSVKDGSCQACDGGSLKDCTNAICASGYQTYNDGACQASSCVATSSDLDKLGLDGNFYCTNGGIIGGTTGHCRCSCTDGYVGKHCEQASKCDAQTVDESHTTDPVADAHFNDVGTEYKCSAGYKSGRGINGDSVWYLCGSSGHFILTPTSGCEAQPCVADLQDDGLDGKEGKFQCLHDGKIFGTTGKGQCRCDCKTGYTGTHCEKTTCFTYTAQCADNSAHKGYYNLGNAQECAASPCLHHECCQDPTDQTRITGIALQGQSTGPSAKITAGHPTKITLTGTVAFGDSVAWAINCGSVNPDQWKRPTEGKNQQTVFTVDVAGNAAQHYKLCYRASTLPDESVEQKTIDLEVDPAR